VVKLLLDKGGVDPGSKDTVYDQTPLSWAVENGHEAVVKLLLAKGGVNPNSKDTAYGRTPLSWAARNGHEAVVKLLQLQDIDLYNQHSA
jgi:ankyrin repeat protein